MRKLIRFIDSLVDSCYLIWFGSIWYSLMWFDVNLMYFDCFECFDWFYWLIDMMHGFIDWVVVFDWHAFGRPASPIRSARGPVAIGEGETKTQNTKYKKWNAHTTMPRGQTVFSCFCFGGMQSRRPLAARVMIVACTRVLLWASRKSGQTSSLPHTTYQMLFF